MNNIKPEMIRILDDNCLLKETKILVSNEREITALILHCLREIDRRRLYCDLGCSSLFDFCVKQLGYSEGAAYRRIKAARLIAKVPEVEEKIKSGKLNLSQLAMIATQTKNSPELTLKLCQSMEGKSKKESEKALFEITGQNRVPKEKIKRVSVQFTEVKVNLCDETLEKLNRIKGLMGAGDIGMEELINKMADETLMALWQKKIGRKSRCPQKSQRDDSLLVSPRLATRPCLKNHRVSRSISVAVKEKVLARSGGQCEYPSCESNYALQFDHRIPFALGGKNDSENIRMLCPAHNQRMAILALGQRKMAQHFKP